MGTGGNNMPLLCIKEAMAIQSTVIGRKPENGPQGSGHDEEVCFTLTSADRHAVAYCNKNRDDMVKTLSLIHI